MCLLSLYCSYIHSYISCANIAWGNTYLSNLKQISSQQKHSVPIIYNKMKYEPVRKLLRSLKILNVYQINIVNNVFFIHRINTNSAPVVFPDKLTKPFRLYPTSFSKLLNYTKPTNSKEVIENFNKRTIYMKRISNKKRKRNKINGQL